MMGESKSITFHQPSTSTPFSTASVLSCTGVTEGMAATEEGMVATAVTEQDLVDMEPDMVDTAEDMVVGMG